jgi:hypothetical protein
MEDTPMIKIQKPRAGFVVALVAVVSFGIGAAAEIVLLRHRSEDVIAVVGFANPKSFLGAAVVTGDGIIHPMIGISAEDTDKLSEKLSGEHKGVMVVPCPRADIST